MKNEKQQNCLFSNDSFVLIDKYMSQLVVVDECELRCVGRVAIVTRLTRLHVFKHINHTLLCNNIVIIFVFVLDFNFVAHQHLPFCFSKSFECLLMFDPTFYVSY